MSTTLVEIAQHEAVASETSGTSAAVGTSFAIGTFVVVRVVGNGTLSFTCTDTKGNTWTNLGAQTVSGSAVSTVGMFASVLTNAWVSTDTVSIGRGSSGTLAFDVSEVPSGSGVIGSAITGSSATGGTAVTCNGTGGTTLTIPTGGVVVAAVVGQNSSVTLTAGSGFTEDVSIGSTSSSNNRYLHGEYDGAGTSGTITVAATLSTAQQWACIAMAVTTAVVTPPTNPVTPIATYADTGSNVTSGTSTTMGTAYATGTCVIVAAVMSGTGLTPTISDTKTNTWTAITNAQQTGSATTSVYAWISVLTNAWTSSDSITVSRGTSGILCFTAETVAGGTGLDGSATSAIGTSSSTFTAGAITIVSGSAVLSYIGSNISSDTLTPGTGFTADLAQTATGASSTRYLHSEYDAAGVAGAITPAGHLNTGTNLWAQIAFGVATTTVVYATQVKAASGHTATTRSIPSL